MHFHSVATSDHTSKLKKYVLRRTSVRRKSLIAHTIVQNTLEKAPRDSLTKVRDPSDEKPSILCLKHASKEARRTPARHTSQWWYHTTDSSFRGWGQSSEKSASLVTSRGIPPYSPVARHKERISECKATTSDRTELQDMKNDDGIKSTSMTVQDNAHSYLIHATIKELWALRWELDWSDGDQLNKPGQSGSPTNPSW